MWSRKPEPESERSDTGGEPTNAALRSHHQSLTTHAREQHDALTAAIEVLEHALAEAAFQRERPWSDRVALKLDQVRQCVQAHTEGVEEPEGLFDEIKTVEPRLLARVLALEEEHESLAARARQLAGELQRRKPDVDDLRRRAAALSSDLRAHRAAEADLVYEAFWTELGGGD